MHSVIAPALTEVQQQIYEDIKRIIRPKDFWEKLRKRKLDELSARVRELEVYEHQLSPEQMQRLKKARTVIEEGGPYVSDTESESDR